MYKPKQYSKPLTIKQIEEILEIPDDFMSEDSLDDIENNDFDEILFRPANNDPIINIDCLFSRDDSITQQKLHEHGESSGDDVPLKMLPKKRSKPIESKSQPKHLKMSHQKRKNSIPKQTKILNQYKPGTKTQPELQSSQSVTLEEEFMVVTSIASSSKPSAASTLSLQPALEVTQHTIQHCTAPVPEPAELFTQPTCQYSQSTVPEQEAILESRTQMLSPDLPVLPTPAPFDLLGESPLPEHDLEVVDDAICEDEEISSHDSESDSDETDWKKIPLPQIDKVTNYFENGHFDTMIHPVNFFSIVTPPLEYFERFFDTEVLQVIVEETNRYASQQQAKNWIDTNIQELKALLGIFILMGLHPLPDETLYWSTNPLYRVSSIADVMPLKRYKKLMECFHLNDNEKAIPRNTSGYDKLHKLRPLIDKLNNRFKTECTLSKSQSIDECMIKFKGRSSLKQYMPMKPVKRGYKAWARADSLTGYLYQVEIYCGKTDGIVEEGLGPNVVLRLTEDLIGQECHVTFDNFFTSVPLMKELYSRNIYSTGTVRTNRKGVSNMTKRRNAMTKHSSKWRVCENTCCVQWKDTKHVNVLSTAFDPKKIVKVTRTQKDGTKLLVKCPIVISEYTKRMGGVDRFDQQRSHYKLGRRSKKWWMRLFFFLMESALVNSFILYKAVHREKKVTQVKFRERLALGLIDSYTSRKRASGCVAFKADAVPDEIRYSQVGVHMPAELPSFRRCKLCSSRIRNKRSRIKCSKCLVPLCSTPCFEKFHRTDGARIDEN